MSFEGEADDELWSTGHPPEAEEVVAIFLTNVSLLLNLPWSTGQDEDEEEEDDGEDTESEFFVDELDHHDQAILNKVEEKKNISPIFTSSNSLVTGKYI